MADNSSAFNQFNGLTIRDWFAGQALIGYLSNNDTDLRNIIETDQGKESLSGICYKTADYMINEKDKK
jgi:hypothetical protein